MTKSEETKRNGEKNHVDLRSKLSEVKNSPLTNMFEDKENIVVINLFTAVIIGYLGHIALDDILYNTGNQVGLKLIRSSFPNFDVFISLWITVFLSSLILFLGLHIWGRLRLYLAPHSKVLRLWDLIALISLISHWFGVFTFSAYHTLTGQIIYASSVSLHFETFRIFAKTYACVRDSVPKILKNKLKSEDIYFPKFSNFLYFMFAPTLIYKDAYVRLKTPIRWSFVAKWFFHILLAIILISCIFDTTIMADLRNFKRLQLINVVGLCFKHQFAVMIFILLCFYIVLHCVQNIFAEVLGFPYRVFYMNWWTSTDFKQFFFKWNVLVRDWFYIYIYQDVYILTNKNKFLAKYTVFVLSALFHELLITLTAGHCVPVIFFEYFVLVSVVSCLKIKNDRCANIFFWFSLSMGMTFVMINHGLEAYARSYCPFENNTLLTFFTPRMWFCYR